MKDRSHSVAKSEKTDASTANYCRANTSPLMLPPDTGWPTFSSSSFTIDPNPSFTEPSNTCADCFAINAKSALIKSNNTMPTLANSSNSNNVTLGM